MCRQSTVLALGRAQQEEEKRAVGGRVEEEGYRSG